MYFPEITPELESIRRRIGELYAAYFQGHVEQITIVISGPGNSGKTSLANFLGWSFGFTPVHLDDYFLDPPNADCRLNLEKLKDTIEKLQSRNKTVCLDGIFAGHAANDLGLDPSLVIECTYRRGSSFYYSKAALRKKMLEDSPPIADIQYLRPLKPR
jgi:hypothetical protein